MGDLWNNLLCQQYEAALCTLNHCIVSSPDAAWQGKVVNMTFDQAVFHALFYTDYYLGKCPEDLKHQAYHQQHDDFFADYEEMEPRVQVQRYTKESLLDYLQFCRTKAKETLAAETADDLAAVCAFPPKTFSRAELHVYNVRHIQHHAAQLIMRLRMDYQVDTPWFGSGWLSQSSFCLGETYNVTAQANDGFLFHEKTYDLVGISEGKLFEPSNLSLKVRPRSTACRRGYVAEYGIMNGGLVVMHLDITLETETEGHAQPVPGPAINGVFPVDSQYGPGLVSHRYEEINLPLTYSGGLLIAEGFIWELYRHMGFHPPWKYEEVHELIFDDGILTGEYDRSAKMAEVRSLMIEKSKSKLAFLRQWLEIGRTFDRRYSREEFQAAWLSK